MVRLLAIIATLLGASEIATAEDVPLPPTPRPSAYELRLADLPTFKPLPTLLGPNSCGASDVVRLGTIVIVFDLCRHPTRQYFDERVRSIAKAVCIRLTT